MTSEKKTIALIANPHSGQGTERAGVAMAVGSVVTGPTQVFQPTTLSDLDRDAAAISGLGPDLIVLAGGDGTIHQTLTRLIHEYGSSSIPKILLVPAGTMNNLARFLGLTRKTVWETLGQMAVKLAMGEKMSTRTLRPLKVGDEYGFLYGSGFPTQFLQRYYDFGAGGTKSALKVCADSVGKTVSGFFSSGDRGSGSMNTVVRAKTKDGWVESPYSGHTAIVAGRISDVGLGCKVLPGNGISDDEFKFRATTLSPISIAACVPLLWFESPVPGTFDAPASEVRIIYDGNHRRMIDGDLKSPVQEERISLGPPLEFVVG